MQFYLTVECNMYVHTYVCTYTHTWCDSLMYGVRIWQLTSMNFMNAIYDSTAWGGDGLYTVLLHMAHCKY